ncbi:unnamed protein product [Brachionus calyciflorus]|uniref:EF-hand domain-containing protein n=1 Tax=Brachionus calyciflorus TaxID=104777 RepID=A0A814EXU4_9BILA|nr:unnamed protein product [Brachionus calyciflorus]
MINVVISLCKNVNAENQYSDLPPPPTKPERFTSKQQLKDYLVKLHEYYAIIGRPRFGRSSNKFTDSSIESNEMKDHLIPITLAIDVMDFNGDGFLNKDELRNFIKVIEKYI